MSKPEVVKQFQIVLKSTPLMEKFDNYRRMRKLVDCRVRLGGVEFDAHRLVLENASPVFKEFYASYFHSLKVLEVEDRFVSGDIAEAMMEFFYTNRILVNMKNAEFVAVAAHYLILPELLKDVQKFISAHLSQDNILKYFNLSDRCSMEILKRNCIQFVALNHEALFGGNKFLWELTAEAFSVFIKELRTIFVKEDLKKKIFYYIVDWVEFNLPVRHRFMPILLECIPLEELPLRFLIRKVQNHPLVHNKAECNKLLSEALINISKKNSNFHFDVPKLSTSHLYCLGGSDENNEILSSISRFDAYIYEWKQSPQMTCPREFFGAAVLGTKIYIAGGHDSDFRALDKFEVFDSATDSVEELTKMPEPRSFCAATELDGYIYVSGGFDASNQRLNSVIRYNPQNKTWKNVAPMQFTRYNHQMVKMNGCLYALGGKTSSVEKYIPHENRWELMACMAITHSWFSATVHAGRIYCCGEDGFEEYNPELNLWRILPRPKIGTGTTLVSLHSKLWLVGGCYEVGRGNGSSKNKATKAVMEFDFIKYKWRNLPDMDIARKFHSSVVVKK